MALLGVLGCGPSPASVCAHTLELAKAELEGEALAGITVESCVERVNRQKRRMGVSVYRAQARCVLAAGDLAALSDCDAEVVEAD